MSASWDPDREGSFLGTDEFSQNLDNIKTGLSRSRENAVLRDKMDKQMYSMEELDRIDNIGGGGNKRKEPKKSFTDKIGDELE
jgi:Photosynthesis affected mutant 68